MFAKLIVISKKRESVSMKDVLQYSLGPIPWSIALPDLVKKVQSKLLDTLEADVANFYSVPDGSVYVYDGMVLLQQLDGIPLETFGDISEHILKRILNNKAEVIYFVTYQYKENSERIGTTKTSFSRSDTHENRKTEPKAA